MNYIVQVHEIPKSEEMLSFDRVDNIQAKQNAAYDGNKKMAIFGER